MSSEMRGIGRMSRSPRYRELEELAKIIPKIRKYNISFRPNGEYKYCGRCRVFINGDVESLIRCPICRYTLRNPRKARKMKKRIDPSMYGVEVE